MDSRLSTIGLPSTDKATWDGTFSVGEKVRIRKDFAAQRGIDYNSNENIFTIVSINKSAAQPFNLDKKGNNIGGMIRDENPSGYLYRLNNKDTWEGKDLEIFEDTNVVVQQPQPTTTPINSSIAVKKSYTEEEKEHNQELIDDFVLRNDALIEGVAIANTKLYDASIQLLSLLSTKFGTGQQIEKLTEAEIEAKKPKVAVPQPIQLKESLNGFEVGDILQLRYVAETNDPKYFVEVVEILKTNEANVLSIYGNDVSKSPLLTDEWIKMPFKVDTVIIATSTNEEYTITSFIGEYILFTDVNGNKISKRFEDFVRDWRRGNYTIKNQPQPIQPTTTGGGTTWEVGDKFRTKTGIEIYITKKRPSTTVFDKINTKGAVTTDYISNTIIKDNIEKGRWVKIGGTTTTTTPTTTTGIKSFAVGDLFQVQPNTLGDDLQYMYEIVSIIPFMNTINLRNLETDKPTDMSLKSANDYLNDGSYVLMPFKVGTEFEMLVTRGKYTIVKIEGQIVFYVSGVGSSKTTYKYSDKLVAFLQAFKHGSYVPLQPTTTTATLSFKVGDSLITSNGEIWEIKSIIAPLKVVELERANGNIFKQNIDVIKDELEKGNYTLMESSFGMQPTTPQIEVGQVYSSRNTGDYVTIQNVDNSKGEVTWQTVTWNIPSQIFVTIGTPQSNTIAELEDYIDSGIWERVALSKMPKPKATTQPTTTTTSGTIITGINGVKVGDIYTNLVLGGRKYKIIEITPTEYKVESLKNVGTILSKPKKLFEDRVKSGKYVFDVVKTSTTKKTTKSTTGTRPSPSQHASGQSVGTRARGNDGNMWVVKAATNGVKRWVKE